MSMQHEERRVCSAGLPGGPVTHQHCGHLLVPVLRVFIGDLHYSFDAGLAGTCTLLMRQLLLARLAGVCLL